MNIHAVSHSLPHRGPGASRARPRWQPYASNLNLSLASLPKASPAVYLHTPASSISSSSPPSILLHPLSDPDRPKCLIQPVPVANPSLRDAQRTKYAARLVDQAVKSLCDTWHPDDIPTVFTACGPESLCAQPDPPNEPPLAPSLMTAGLSKLFAPRNTQLPSPVSPTSRPSPSPPANAASASESYAQAPASSGGSSNLIPIRGFVHEVLRRSRTSTGVLQTALCYLEAVRAKVPDVLRNEKAHPTADRRPEEDAEPRIVQGLYEDAMLAEPTGTLPASAPASTAGPTLDTVRVDSSDEFGASALSPPTSSSTSATATARTQDQAALPPLPPLPSPLCCPRRTFLACLILASKFIQDRSYSNRAWAKLAGLPPREIGRCERAVGEALEWRLWVGKLPSTPAVPALAPNAVSNAASNASTGSPARTFARTKSDGHLLSPGYPSPSCTSAATAAWAAAATADRWISPSQECASFPTPLPTPRATRVVRRSATVPALASARVPARVPAEPFFLPLANECRYGYAPGTGSASVTMADAEPPFEVSPASASAMLTPGLSYSPMSSASSSSSDGSEERTIQMAMFVDLPTPEVSYPFTFSAPSSSSSSASSFSAPSSSFSAYAPLDLANPFRSAGYIPAPHRPYTTSALASSSASVSFSSTSTHCADTHVYAYAPEDPIAARAGPLPPPNHNNNTGGAAKVQLPSFADAFAFAHPGGASDPGMRALGSR